MFTTVRNSHTKIVCDIIILKVYQEDNLFSIEPVPYEISVELTAENVDGKLSEEEITVNHSVNYQKVRFLIENVIHEAFYVSPDVSPDWIKLAAEMDNGLLLGPGTGEAVLGAMLHAKVATICDNTFVGAVEVVDKRTKTCYNYVDEDGTYSVLPEMKDFVNGLTFHEQPWWFRRDTSTYDGTAANEEEYQNYIDNHFEEVQQVVTQPLIELEEKIRQILDRKEKGELIDLETVKKKKWKPKIV